MKLAALPLWLRDRLPCGDTEGAVARLLDESFDGSPVICECNAWRNDLGHMESCPLHGFASSVVVIDGGAS